MSAVVAGASGGCTQTQANRGTMSKLGKKLICAAKEARAIARNKPTDEECFEYRLKNHPRLLRRIERARETLQTDRGTRLEDLETD